MSDDMGYLLENVMRLFPCMLLGLIFGNVGHTLSLGMLAYQAMFALIIVIVMGTISVLLANVIKTRMRRKRA